MKPLLVNSSLKYLQENLPQKDAPEVVGKVISYYREWLSNKRPRSLVKLGVWLNRLREAVEREAPFWAFAQITRLIDAAKEARKRINQEYPNAQALHAEFDRIVSEANKLREECRVSRSNQPKQEKKSVEMSINSLSDRTLKQMRDSAVYERFLNSKENWPRNDYTLYAAKMMHFLAEHPFDGKSSHVYFAAVKKLMGYLNPPPSADPRTQRICQEQREAARKWLLDFQLKQLGDPPDVSDEFTPTWNDKQKVQKWIRKAQKRGLTNLPLVQRYIEWDKTFRHVSGGSAKAK